MDCGCQDSACDSRRPCAVSVGTHLTLLARRVRATLSAAVDPGLTVRSVHCVPLNSLAPETAGGLWVGSATGSLVLNLASFELEAVLRYKGKREAGQPALPPCNGVS